MNQTISKEQSFVCEKLIENEGNKYHMKKMSKQDALEIVNDLRLTLHNELMEALAKEQQRKDEQEENLKNVLKILL